MKDNNNKEKIVNKMKLINILNRSIDIVTKIMSLVI